jgi:hypothetical protein
MLVQGQVRLWNIVRIIFSDFFSDSSHNFGYKWLWKFFFFKLRYFWRPLVKHRKIAAAAAAAKGNDYNPTEIAFWPYLAVAAWPKTIHNHIVHSHHHLSRGRRNWKSHQDPQHPHLTVPNRRICKKQNILLSITLVVSGLPIGGMVCLS